LRLGDLYRLIVNTGIKHDPRKKSEVKAALSRNKKAYKALKGKKRAAFDRDSLFNPYCDTRILYGEPDREINTIMVGIDIETGELLLADRLGQKGSPVDLVMSHHPWGRSYADLYKVMHLQTDLLKGIGLLNEAADEMMGQRMRAYGRG
jgi:hypothetical protein